MAEVRVVLPNVKVFVWLLLSRRHKGPRLRLSFIEEFRNSDLLRFSLYNQISRGPGGILILTVLVASVIHIRNRISNPVRRKIRKD